MKKIDLLKISDIRNNKYFLRLLLKSIGDTNSITAFFISNLVLLFTLHSVIKKNLFYFVGFWRT